MFLYTFKPVYCYGLIPGITYVTFTKTSEAALAQEEMNGRVLPGHPKPLKVCTLQDSWFSVRECGLKF